MDAKNLYSMHALHATTERAPGGGRGAYHVRVAGKVVGHAEVIRGFAHYTGVRGSAHFGGYAVVACAGANELTPLIAALHVGLRNGRRDDLAND